MENGRSHILLVEDDSQLINILGLMFERKGYNFEIAHNGLEAMESLERRMPDLIVSDIMMPKMDGLQFRKKILQVKDYSLIPFVFLTAKNKKEEKLQGLRLRVDDYITKPFEIDEFLARLDSIIERQNLLKDLILFDPLTNLYNRRSLENRLKYELKRVKRYKQFLSLLIFDLDHFKTVNDTYGHIAGDDVLKGVAELLHTSLRDVDFAARYGGEEFVLVMPDTDKSQARLVGDRLRKDIEQAGFGDHHIRVTVSGGIATAPTDSSRVRFLINKADKALYRAKLNGRNRIEVYE